MNILYMFNDTKSYGKNRKICTFYQIILTLFYKIVIKVFYLHVKVFN